MKIKILLAALIGLVGTMAQAQLTGPNPIGYTSYGGTGTAQGATNSFAVVSAVALQNGTPVLTYVNANCDTAGNKIQFWNVTNFVDLVSNTTTTVYFWVTNNASPAPVQGSSGTLAFGGGSTNWFSTPQQVFCLRHGNGDTYEFVQSAVAASQSLGLLYVTNTTVTSAGVGGGAQTNSIVTVQGSIVLKYAPATTVASGDRLYLESPGGAIPIVGPPIAGVTNCIAGGSGGVIYVGQKGAPLMMNVVGAASESINVFSATYQ